jgi:superfamily II DNA or RNA helicase
MPSVKPNKFRDLQPKIDGNPKLRDPQIEGYDHIVRHFEDSDAEREVGVVLPVGCGKSGLIAIAPFGLKANRVLVVAPGLRIAAQLLADVDPANPDSFYRKCAILDGPDFPEPADIRGKTTNASDLDGADIAITNIHQLQGQENRWLANLTDDFFDLILVDEGHHNVASSWDLLRQKFPAAKIINFSATPTRADGQLMAGKIIYSFPIFSAIEKGYVKRLKAAVLNPAKLRYVRRKDDAEIEVSLDEVRRLGETDADFRRSIVSSSETLRTIVDCSINELRKLRQATGDLNHKIIASALNYQHCIQITEAYKARNLRAAYIHSKEDGAANERTLKKLNNHELDVIVQVRMLGEGFDHPYLSVAAVCSIFANLGPFVQFVGRIMRAIEPNKPASLLNQGIVVFHAGANVAQRWSDFQNFSQADRDFFDQLLPIEDITFDHGDELIIVPDPSGAAVNSIQIRDQERVMVEEIPLITRDEQARKALEYLISQGFTADDYAQAQHHVPIPVTKQRQRQAARGALDDQIRNAAGKALHERGINPKGRELDRKRLGRDNFVVLKAAIDKRVNACVGKTAKQRDTLSQAELDQIDGALDGILADAVAEIINGAT